jgi:hypothetical protein
MRTETVLNPHDGSFWFIRISESGSEIRISRKEAELLIEELQKELDEGD